MKITITLQKDADETPRYANVEIDDLLVELSALSEVQAISREIAPYIEAMLQLEKPE